MKEAELIALLRQKDERGMAALLAEYGALMRYVAAPFLADGRDLEECVSEAAMRVWNGADRFDPARGGWTAWLTAVTRNTALNLARKAGRGGADLPEDASAPGPSPEEAVLRAERQAAVRRALDALPEKDRLLFYRKYYYRQSTAQIARETGLSPRAVEGRLYRLRLRLRDRLGGERDG